VGDDGDEMAMQPVTPALRLLSGVSCLHGRQLVYFHGTGNRSATRVGGGAHALSSRARVMAHVPVGAGGRSCEAETSRARRRLVVRGRDLSYEAKTCCGDSSGRELVGDAAN
jgi:hypothetical protein